METKKGADSLEHWLCINGFPATTIHGDRTQQVNWLEWISWMKYWMDSNLVLFFFLFLIINFIGKLHTLPWVLNPQPHPSLCTYKGRSAKDSIFSILFESITPLPPSRLFPSSQSSHLFSSYLFGLVIFFFGILFSLFVQLFIESIF